MAEALNSAAIFTELKSLVGADAVLTDAASIRAYDCDGYTPARNGPLAVVLPSNTEQVSAIVKLCAHYGLWFTPRGSGTGLSGGSTPMCGGIVISTTRLNRILHIDVPNRRLIAQAGVVNTYLSRAVKADQLHYAPDPSSQGACTVGGNVAENAGGPHTLKYGVTTNHIVGVTMVMEDGEVVQLGGLAEDPAGYDLVGLVVGSEGTTGLVTEVTIRLTPLPQGIRTMLAIFDSAESAVRTVSSIVAAGVLPAALEMIDTFIIKACEDAFHLGFPDDAEAVLIIEVDGLEAGLQVEVDRVTEIAFSNGAREVRSASTERERALLWKARKQSFGALGRLGLSMVTHDGVIPRTKLPEVLARVKEISGKYNILAGNVFHAGDGNIHPNLMYNEHDPLQLEAVMLAGQEILRLCVEVGGSITGEHGVGVEKIDVMQVQFSPQDIALMEAIKSVFNPTGLCNPGKLFPTAKRCWETEHGTRMVKAAGRGAAV